MTTTLVIDTSYGSTVGVVGRQPVVETDSRTHVERLQVDIDRALGAAGLTAADVERIVVGIGPAPYTGLRVGIVAAKAIAFATGALLQGVDALLPQSALVAAARAGIPGMQAYEPAAGIPSAAADPDVRHLTLAVNDARRKQLYFSLFDEVGYNRSLHRIAAPPRVLVGMDIDSPENIVKRVDNVVNRLVDACDGADRYAVDVVGRGVARYAGVWPGLQHLGSVVAGSVQDAGVIGLELVAGCADLDTHRTVEPLYLRRPDVSVPNPLKHVLTPVVRGTVHRR